MVSYIEIIKRLMEGDYDTMTGHPDAPSRFREFVRAVRERVPELRAKEDWEVESTVLDAFEWAIESHCKLVRDYSVGRGNYYNTVEMYACFHPEIGDYYIVKSEEADGDSGYGYVGYLLTRDRKRALETFKSEKEDIEESWEGE